MSFVSKTLPLTFLAAALVSACSDVSSPTQAFSAPPSALAKKGGSGGGGGGDSDGTVQLVITTPPTVNTTGTWVGTTDGPDITHTYTFTLTQTDAGMVSGVASFTTGFLNGSQLVIGTVNGDTLELYGGAGTVCTGCQLVPYFRGTVSNNSSRIDGSFASGGTHMRLFKQ